MSLSLSGLSGLSYNKSGSGSFLPSGNEPEVDTYIANVLAVGGTVFQKKIDRLNIFISAIKSFGIRDKIDRLNIFAGSDSFIGSMVPLIDDLFLGNSTTNLTFQRWSPLGIRSNGTGFVDFKYIPFQHLENANSLHIYANINPFANHGYFEKFYGTKEDANKILSLEVGGGTNWIAFSYANTNASENGMQLTAGNILFTQNSTNNFIKNNNTLIGNSGGSPQYDPPNFPMYLFAENNAGTPNQYSADNRLFCFSMGKELTATEQTNYLSAMNAYKTASPYCLFGDDPIYQPNFPDGIAYELGVIFTPLVNGKITHFRYWRSSEDTATVHTGRLWNYNTQAELASVEFENEAPSGWQQQALTTPIAVQANTEYTVTVNIGSHSPIAETTFIDQVTIRNISIRSTGSSYGPIAEFPSSSYWENYLRDIIFVED